MDEISEEWRELPMLAPETAFIAITVALSIAAIVLLSGCAVVYPTEQGFAAATVLANTRHIEVSKTGATIDGVNVSNPIGTTLSGAAGLMMLGGVGGALP